MSETILRDATVKDLRAMISLMNKYLNNIKIPLNEDPDMLRISVIEFIAESLADTNSKILVVDKSGRLIGLFIAKINYTMVMFKRNIVCEILVAYTNKSSVYVKKIMNEFTKWAKSKNCNALSAYVVASKEKLQKTLIEALGTEKTYIIYEKSI